MNFSMLNKPIDNKLKSLSLFEIINITVVFFAPLCSKLLRVY